MNIIQLFITLALLSTTFPCSLIAMTDNTQYPNHATHRSPKTATFIHIDTNDSAADKEEEGEDEEDCKREQREQREYQEKRDLYRTALQEALAIFDIKEAQKIIDAAYLDYIEIYDWIACNEPMQTSIKELRDKIAKESRIITKGYRLTKNKKIPQKDMEAIDKQTIQENIEKYRFYNTLLNPQHSEKHIITQAIDDGDVEQLQEFVTTSNITIKVPYYTEEASLLQYTEVTNGRNKDEIKKYLQQLLDAKLSDILSIKNIQQSNKKLAHLFNTKLIFDAQNLISLGAHVDTKNKNGASLLHIATIIKNSSCVSQLLNRNANPNAQLNKNGDTPLHVAIKVHASINIIKKLLQHGADRSIINKDGNTPLGIARTEHQKLSPESTTLKEYYQAVINELSTGDSPTAKIPLKR